MKNLLLILLFPLALIAQDNTGENIREEFSNYYNKEIPLKVHLFLNQEEYYPGDTIFFKAWLLTARDFFPVAGSTILNIVLKDHDGKSLIRQMIRLRHGEGHNQMILPAEIPQGYYILEAYADWMKNFGSPYYFQKQINIGEQTPAKDFASRASLEFYPEGGSLVAGLNNKVVVRGRKLTNGKIYNSHRQIVANYSLDQYGLGFFHLTPQPSEIYSGNADNETESFLLPEPKNDGVVLLATYHENDAFLRTIIQMPITSRLRQGIIHLVASGQGNIFYQAHFEMLDKEYALINIPLTGIPAGIAQLSLYGENKTSLGTRLFFVRERDEVTPVISFQNNEYATREKISLTCKLLKKGDIPVQSKMAVSVFRKSQTATTAGDENIVNNLLFYNDIPNASAQPHGFFGTNVSYSSIDNYLITQPPVYPRPSNQNQKYFINYIHLTGKALTNSGAPLPDSSKITFFLQKSISTYQAYVKDSAFQVFFLLDFYGAEEIFYRAEHKGEKLDDVKIVLDEEPLYEPVNLRDAKSDNSSFSAKRKDIIESFSFFNKDTRYTEVPEPHNLFEEEIFGADLEIKLEDYIPFPTMEETLREVIPMVQHRMIGGRQVVRVFIDELDQFAEGSPLFVIDGVMTEDVQFFLSLPPAEVSAIKVVNSPEKLDVFGALGKGGIILVETKIPDHAAIVPKGENTFSAIGLTEPLKFNSAEYINRNGRTPDLRTALYWNPEIVTDENGMATFSFYSTDVTGEFVIRLEGITADGKPFYKEEDFTVKFVPASD